MARASADRPSRRLDAFLAAVRRHGTIAFKAAKLEGVGEGLEFEFAAPAPARRPSRASQAAAADPDLAAGDIGEPVDELALVAQGLEGPVSDRNGRNGVS